MGKPKVASDDNIVMPDYTRDDAKGKLVVIGGAISRDDEQQDDELTFTLKAEVRTREDSCMRDIVLPECLDTPKVRANLQSALAGKAPSGIEEPTQIWGSLEVMLVDDAGEPFESTRQQFSQAKLEQMKLECAGPGKARILYKWKFVTDPFTVGVVAGMLGRAVFVRFLRDQPALPLKKATSLEGEA